jgi:hypothetical protein
MTQQYTAAVNMVADYVANTEHIFAVAQGKFAEVQGQLEYAVQLLKSHSDYDGERTVLS